ncbi:MAG: type III polyketide synthase [Candidatus Binataceae bacterium]
MTQVESLSPAILSAASALPTNYVDQDLLTAALRELWSRRHSDVRRFDQIQHSLGIRGRYLALPISEYPPLDTFASTNDAWIRVAPELGRSAVSTALDRAGLSPSDVDHLFFVTVTGIATPSIDTRIISALGMKQNVKRTPIFGLGCVAGAAGLARATDYVRAFPDEVAVLLSVELCSLTLQRDDLSVANIIASGLFGDGAAAAVIGGGARTSTAASPRVIATRSILYPGTEDILGWDLVEGGFKIVLSARLSNLIGENIEGEVDTFLAAHGLERTAIRHWIAHTGGPKVLESLERSLTLPEGALARSWRSLGEMGNLSSASVLFILEDLLRAEVAQPGEYGLMIGMGPGFSIEIVLLGW